MRNRKPKAVNLVKCNATPKAGKSERREEHVKTSSWLEDTEQREIELAGTHQAGILRN